jgi:hypothetical protein
VSNITGRLRAVIGALGILMFASPLAAQTHYHGGRMRVAAQWIERSQGEARQMRWRRAAVWRMDGMGWQRHYAVRYGWRGPAFRRPWLHRGWVIRAGPRRALLRRPWRRHWAHWRYGVG